MISTKEIVLRLLVAAALGALVGLERERKDWTAGLRTHMIVCTGSCLVILVSAFGFRDILGTPNVVLDPSRVAAQVISGIGFLGAGTILFLRQEVVRGLTTAAGLWTVAAVGLATGSGMYVAACVTTLIVLITLAFLNPVKQMIYDRHEKNIKLRVSDQKQLLNQIHESIGKEESLRQIVIYHDKETKEDIIQIYFHRNLPVSRLLDTIEKLKRMDGVNELSYKGAEPS